MCSQCQIAKRIYFEYDIQMSHNYFHLIVCIVCEISFLLLEMFYAYDEPFTFNSDYYNFSEDHKRNMKMSSNNSRKYSAVHPGKQKTPP